MAKIPLFQPDPQLDIPNAPFYPRRSESVPAIGAGAAKGAEIAGRNLATLGGAVQNFGGDVTAIAQQKEAEANQAWLANARAQTTLDWATKVEPGLYSGANASGGAGLSAPVASGGKPTSLQDQTKQAVTDYTATILKTAPNARAKTAYQEWAAEFGAQAQIKAFNYQQKAADAQKESDLTSALDKHTQLVASDPSQYDAAWAAAQQDLQNAAGWASPEGLTALRAKTEHDLQWARAKTLSTQQPLAFQREITPTQYDAASGTGTPYKGFVDNPYYSKLDVSQLAAFSNDANSAVVKQHNEVLAQQKQVYDQQYNGLMTSLLPGGRGGMADITKARSDGWLTDYTDIKKAVDAVDQRDKDSMNLAKATALFQTGHTFNPFEKADKDATDLVYKAAGGADGLITPPSQPGLSAPVPGSSGSPQAAAAIRLRAFVEKTDIIPQSAVDEIRRGMVSQDQNQMMTAYSIMDGLSRENPSAAKEAFGEADMKKLDQYQQLAPITKPEDLVKAMNPNVDQVTAKQREQLQAAGKKLLDGEVAKGTDYLPDIVSHFSPGMLADWANWKSAPTAPKDATELQALRNDYEAAYTRLYGLSGDETSAKAGALAALDRKWGVSEIGSTIQIMPRPPERSFPAIAGDHHWMDQQAEDQVNAIFPGAQSWAPVTLPETEGAIGVRATPSWGLAVVDKDGTYHVLTPPSDAKPGWPFDYEAAQAKSHADFNAARGSLLPIPPGASFQGSKLKRIEDFVRPPAGNVVPFKPSGGPIGSEQ